MSIVAKTTLFGFIAGIIGALLTYLLSVVGFLLPGFIFGAFINMALSGQELLSAKKKDNRFMVFSGLLFILIGIISGGIASFLGASLFSDGAVLNAPSGISLILALFTAASFFGAFFELLIVQKFLSPMIKQNYITLGVGASTIAVFLLTILLFVTGGIFLSFGISIIAWQTIMGFCIGKIVASTHV